MDGWMGGWMDGEMPLFVFVHMAEEMVMETVEGMFSEHRRK
jgi:hypothetical protein